MDDTAEDDKPTVSSVSHAMDKINQKPGQHHHTSDLVHLTLIFLVISRKQKCDSISKEFDTTFRIKPCEGEQNSGKYLEWIESVTKFDSRQPTQRKQIQRKKWKKRIKTCKEDGCFTNAHLTSREGFCLSHTKGGRKCTICKVKASRRVGGKCEKCYRDTNDSSFEPRCKQCDLGRPRKTGGLCPKCLG